MNEWVDWWMSEWIDEWVSGLMNEWVDWWMSEWIGEWVNGLMNEWVGGWLSSKIYKDSWKICFGMLECQIGRRAGLAYTRMERTNGWMDKTYWFMDWWTNEWWMNWWMDWLMNRWKDKWMNERTDGWMYWWKDGKTSSADDAPRAVRSITPRQRCSWVSCILLTSRVFFLEKADQTLQQQRLSFSFVIVIFFFILLFFFFLG